MTATPKRGQYDDPNAFQDGVESSERARSSSCDLVTGLFFELSRMLEPTEPFRWRWDDIRDHLGRTVGC